MEKSQFTNPSSLPQVAKPRLVLATPKQQVKEKAKAEKSAQYRRQYWQEYRKRNRRVFGTIGIPEYAAWAALAKQHGRSVWGQIINCARAYMAGTEVAPKEILENQKNLVGEIRYIGNNLNQLARLGHLRVHKSGGLTCDPIDDVGREVMRQLTRLEKKVTAFETATPKYTKDSKTDAAP